MPGEHLEKDFFFSRYRVVKITPNDLHFDVVAGGGWFKKGWVVSGHRVEGRFKFTFTHNHD